MAVAFDAVASNSVANNAGTTLSWTHTPVGTPTAVAVGLEDYTGTTTVTGVTYGGSALAKATSQLITGNNGAVEIWGLANPPSGAQTVVVTFAAAGAYSQAGSITVTGSDTTTTFTSANSAEGSGTTASVSVTSNSGELVVDVVGTTGVNPVQTEGGSQTKRWGRLDASTQSASGSTLAASASSTGMSWTFDITRPWGHAAASFKAAAGGGGSKVPLYMLRAQQGLN